MKIVRTYTTRLEAGLASVQLRGEGIAATIVGIGLEMEGGTDGVRLLVPDDEAERALEILGKG